MRNTVKNSKDGKGQCRTVKIVKAVIESQNGKLKGPGIKFEDWLTL